MTRFLFPLAGFMALIGLTAAAGEKVTDTEATDAEAAETEALVFLHALDNKPFEFTYRPDQEITEAVEHMHTTGKNLYAGDEAAIKEGKKLYMKYCKACHLKDGKGRIGPNLRDDEWKRERTGTEKGRFEIIYAGGAGAMQALGRRIDQDQILKIMAFTDTFQETEEQE
ncbi:MAG: c-type cytochrome [Geminicoccaceae bacterium]